MSTFRSVVAAFAVTVASAGAPVAAQQLVLNGDFEAGSFTGWTQTGNVGFADVSPGVQHAGSFGALFGPVGSPGGIVQTLATVAGTVYDYSFWLQSTGGAPNSFAWLLNGVGQMPALTNVADFGYTRFAGTFLASGAATQLAFSFRSDPGFWLLDDVSVTAVPEPAEWMLMMAGLASMAWVRRLKGRAAKKTR